MKNSIEILEAHNAWRRGAEIAQGNAVEIGKAIDDCVYAAKCYEVVRTLNLTEFYELCRRNINGENFDDLIEELVNEKEK